MCKILVLCWCGEFLQQIHMFSFGSGALCVAPISWMSSHPGSNPGTCCSIYSFKVPQHNHIWIWDILKKNFYCWYAVLKCSIYQSKVMEVLIALDPLLRVRHGIRNLIRPSEISGVARPSLPHHTEPCNITRVAGTYRAHPRPGQAARGADILPCSSQVPWCNKLHMKIFRGSGAVSGVVSRESRVTGCVVQNVENTSGENAVFPGMFYQEIKIIINER